MRHSPREKTRFPSNSPKKSFKVWKSARCLQTIIAESVQWIITKLGVILSLLAMMNPYAFKKIFAASIFA
ncbi:hypothetical protein SLA2020_134480 [Shorea laevis]